MPNREFAIRLACDNDAKQIAEIYNEAIRSTTATFDTEPKSVEDRQNWLAEHDERHPVWVATVAEEVVGWITISKWSDRPAYRDTGETSFYVSSQYRGQGIGRALKIHCIEQARMLGYHTLLSRVAQESSVSLHLNQSLGFQLIGTMREVGLKFGKRLDVHILQLMLNE